MNTLKLESRYKVKPMDAGKYVREPGVQHEAGEASAYEGLWESPLGSLYVFDGTCFTCVCVHAAAFRGWIGRVAVKDVHIVGTAGTGMQAFRNRQTGKVGSWVPVSLSFKPNIVTKFFPDAVPAGDLVNGRVEQYRRISAGHEPRGHA